jgi:uncharacterized membrane protein YjjB (DUF3815 family)
MSFACDLLVDMAVAAGPAIGFGMVGHVPVRFLKYCAAGGAVGHGLRFTLLYCGIPIEWATLVAALVVSTLGIHLSQWLRVHPKAFTVASMIPMVPGVSFFTALLAFMQIHQKGYSPELMATAVSSGLKAFLIIAALAVGLALPGLLFYRGKPVV